VYPYVGSVTHGDIQVAHVAALSAYAETHVKVELVKVSKLVAAACRAAGPVSLKLRVTHSLLEGPAVIRPPVMAGGDVADVVVVVEVVEASP
jgi:hypothetical protein